MAIQGISEIDIEKEAFMKKANITIHEKALFSNMFEIHLKEDYEDLY